MPRTPAIWLCLTVAAVGAVIPRAGLANPEIDSSPPLERRQHLDQLGVTRWHRLGCRGQGVKVAVLDTGFHGWREFLGRGLPKQVKADGDLEARASQHGILCAEIVHALAPEAELLIANWDTDVPASFLQAVRWAKEQGARVLTCSVIMPSWSDGEGGGNVHAALDLLIDKDLLFFASAGNVAQRHWSGPLRLDARGWHQWRGTSVANTLEPWSNDRVVVELYGPIDCAGTLQVVDGGSGAVVSQAPFGSTRCERQTWAQAQARFDPEPRHNYQIRLKCSEGGKPVQDAKFHLVALGGNLEYSKADGSISFPADGARVLAVGAVDRRGLRAPYSSCGPNSRLPKPDFVAMVPFASQCRERPFSGTSAAAPQAAALAALWWSRQPAWSAAQVSAALHAAAFDLGPLGHDWETGYGLIRLPLEVSAALNSTGPLPWSPPAAPVAPWRHPRPPARP